MKKVLLWTALPLALAGCDIGSSMGEQVERCVQSYIKIQIPFKDKEARDLAEWQGRLVCLRAAAGANGDGQD